MQKSIIKRKLRQGELVLMPKVCFVDPSIVEMLGRMGFDGIWICTEYKAIDPSTMDNMVRACRAAGVDCIIRTGVHSDDDLPRLLSMGANGLMIPHVENPESIRRVIARIKFPPLGQRELETVNADADFGLMPLGDYLQFANDETFVIAQVESVEAIEHAEEIASIEGVDVVFVGPGDLSLNMGIPGQVKHARVVEAIKRVVQACKSTNAVCGTQAISQEHCRMLVNEGVKFFGDGSDWRALLVTFQAHIEAYGKLGFSFQTQPHPCT